MGSPDRQVGSADNAGGDQPVEVGTLAGGGVPMGGMSSPADQLGDYGPQPTMADYQGVGNTNTPGNPYHLSNTDYTMGKDYFGGGVDTAGYDVLKNEATRDPGSNSQWGQYALQQNSNDMQDQNNLLSEQQAGQLAGARSNLAQAGGLSGAASERLGKSGALSGLLGQQDVSRQGASNALNINMQDELNRLATAKDVSGLALQNRASEQTDAANKYKQDYTSSQMSNDADRFNITNMVNDLGGQNSYNLNKYGIDNSSWAAGKIADAAAKSEGKNK